MGTETVVREPRIVAVVANLLVAITRTSSAYGSLKSYWSSDVRRYLKRATTPSTSLTLPPSSPPLTSASLLTPHPPFHPLLFSSILTPPLGEAWEEAGITGRVTRNLGEIRDPRTSTKSQQRSLYYFFEFHVEREEDRWPEMHKRKRRWLTYEEAKNCFTLMGRGELLEALERSSVLRK